MTEEIALRPNELNIMKQCLARLNELPGPKAEQEHGLLIRDVQNQIDAFITIRIKNRKYIYAAEIKHRVTATIIPHVVWTLKEKEPYLRHVGKEITNVLLCAEYINDNAALKLRNLHTNYIDTVGNTFLTGPNGLYILVQGKRQTIRKERQLGRLFQPTGLKTIANLLVNPQIVNLPQRAIGHEAGVALGTVTIVMRELREAGYIEQIGPKTYRLANKKPLFDKWVDGYMERLRPKLFVNRFMPKIRDLDQCMEQARKILADNQKKWAITGEYAADLLTHYYRGPNLTLFIKEWTDDLLLELDWIPAKNGPITVLDGFGLGIFTGPVVKGINLAPELLIYAELLTVKDDRTLDVAARLYNQFIKGLIENEKR
jgi:hypothetical protein